MSRREEFVMLMRISGSSPSIVPPIDQDVYLVLDDLGRLGRILRETDVEDTGLETVITDLLAGQYGNPIGVFAFNAAEGWSRDASEDVARELRRRCGLEGHVVPESIRDFVERPEGPPARACGGCVHRKERPQLRGKAEAVSGVCPMGTIWTRAYNPIGLKLFLRK